MPEKEPEKHSYAYQYPRLFSGGVQPKAGTDKDYAAWLIAEYYRFLEIVVFIPFGILLSLPFYAAYALVYLICTIHLAEGFTLGAAHIAFALWTFVVVFAWAILWPAYWVPLVVQPVYASWVQARRAAIDGLIDFVKNG